MVSFLEGLNGVLLRGSQWCPSCSTVYSFVCLIFTSTPLLCLFCSSSSSFYSSHFLLLFSSLVSYLLLLSFIGVPMLKSVAGVACGLILDSESGSNDTTRYQILSDITVNFIM